MQKVYKNAWTKSTKAHRFKNRRQTNPLLKTIAKEYNSFTGPS